MNLKNLTIGQKLIAAFSSVASLTLILGALGYHGAVQSDRAIEEIGLVRLPSVQSLLIMSEAQMAVESAENNLLCTKHDRATRQALHQSFAATKQRADDAWKVYEPLPQTSEEAATWKAFVPAWEAWWQTHLDYVALAQKYEVDKQEAAYDAMVKQSLEVNDKAFGKAEELLKKLVEINKKVAADTTKTAEAQANTQKVLSLTAAILGVALALGLGLAISRNITHPIRRTVEMLKDISQGEGDLTKRLSVTSQDEIGELAKHFNQFVEKLQGIIGRVAANAVTVASSATELSAVSSQTTNAVRTMSEKTASVAAAAEEASANTNSVAASMEQAATNLASVASATEEMSATVGEIAANSEKARTISEQATAQAQTISTLMQQLGRAAQEIGKVTETITDISSQTNLLALNATIEAARAGAAGKGFAVVANEIKELARQTATATEDIKSKIAGVQNSAGSAIADIEKIAGVIQEVGAIVASIAASIEEQAAVTKDVAGNIAQASAGVKDSTERIAQTATVSKDIARDMTGVNEAVGDIRQGGEQVQASTVELSQLAEQLKATAGQFKV
jgi:methyl-accepting chemotaxis protein